MKFRYVLFSVYIMIILMIGFGIIIQHEYDTRSIEDEDPYYHHSFTQTYDMADFNSMSSSFMGYSGSPWINATITFNVTPLWNILFVLVTPETTFDTGVIVNSSGTFPIIPNQPLKTIKSSGYYFVNRSYFEPQEYEGVKIYFRYADGIGRPKDESGWWDPIVTVTIDGYQLREAE